MRLSCQINYSVSHSAYNIICLSVASKAEPPGGEPTQHMSHIPHSHCNIQQGLNPLMSEENVSNPIGNFQSTCFHMIQSPFSFVPQQFG
ncbi:hypothetical protein XENTR_v10020750 [Xenopus tropicalis]|nr:hypothetical protein XENTR_v10020750 [Xenopus tropicalis]